MSRLSTTKQNKQQRQNRVRSTVHGTKERPRLSVFISNRHIVAQIIDDTKGQTLVAVTTAGSKTASAGTMTEKAAWVGEEIAKKAKTGKVKKVVFDRGSKLYHGRVAAVAEAARKAGLEF
ncbi:MAG: 50S ribosomal protein L18 [Candidatus Saccharimonadales bacterium]